MKSSYLTILVMGSVFSATALGLSIAAFSRLKKERQRKKLQSGDFDKVEQDLKLGRDDLTKATMKSSDTEVKTVTTSGSGLENGKVRRVRKYKSNGKPIYE